MNTSKIHLWKWAVLAAVVCGLAPSQGHAQIIVTDEALPADGSGNWQFSTIPDPSSTDLLEGLSPIFTSNNGSGNGLHSVSGPLSNLTNGLVQSNNNDVTPNQSPGGAGNVSVFFSDPGGGNGAVTDARLLYNLGSVDTITQINTFSWHLGSRAPQNFAVYGANSFTGDPAVGVDPTTLGFTLIATVNTNDLTPNLTASSGGAQEGSSIQNSTLGGTLGNYQYILYDILPANGSDPGTNTFYGELDVVGSSQAIPEPSTYGLILSGLALLAFVYRQRRRNSCT